LTPVPRPIEIGIFTVGSNADWTGILIPPQQKSFEFNYFCHNDCLDVFLKFFLNLLI